jgi:hypothetical protein
MELSRFARGALVIAFNARSGPIPLRLVYLGGQEGSGKVRRSECPVSTVPEPTESCRFEIHGFARFLRTFSSERSASVSFSF